ncbi:MAG: hypothetical protein ACC707_16795 [Thiohalomonadales bacterium]
MLKISRQEWEEWREGLTTKIFLDYCKALSEREGDFAKKDFLGGAFHNRNMLDVAVVSGKAIAWSELGEINYEEIEVFYEKERESHTDEPA